MIALEPESASIYCQHIKFNWSDQQLSVVGTGTRYMVVDLGGLYSIRCWNP